MSFVNFERIVLFENANGPNTNSTIHMSRSTRKPTLWTLRKKVDPDQPAQSAQDNLGQHLPSQGDRGIE